MSRLGSNIELGIAHIADFAAMDHALFLLALCSVYSLKNWKPLLFLVTAFTLGHSLTLAIAGLDLFRMQSDIIEWLIPVSIVLTALYHLADQRPRAHPVIYAICAIFGMVHGMGFSSYFRMIRNDDHIVVDLLGFNIGVELGQLLIIALILILGYVMKTWGNMSRRDWNVLSNGFCLGAGILLVQQTWPF